jgi:hypothetical protein
MINEEPEPQPRYAVMLTWAELHWLSTALSMMTEMARHCDDPSQHEDHGNAVLNHVQKALQDFVPDPDSAESAPWWDRVTHIHISKTRPRAQINFAAHLVFKDGKEVHLTPTELKVLRSLAVRAGKVVSYTDLITDVWDEATVANGILGLRTMISVLRRKLEPEPAKPRWITTVPAVGYMLQSKDEVTFQLDG